MSDILKVIELAKVGRCTPEQWEALPLEIRQRILEIRIDVRVPERVNINHNVKVEVPKAAELGFKAGFGWTMGKTIANTGAGCFWFVILIIILTCPLWLGFLAQLLVAR